MEPWTPIDTLSILKLLNFHLSWNWGQDLIRNYIGTEASELKSMIDELVPFTSEYTNNLVTIMNEDDAKDAGWWSDESLLDKYHES